MRRWLVLTVAALFIVVGVGSAFADVDVTATIDKYKDIRIVEKVYKIKLVVLVPFVLLRAEKAAESDALINQTNFANRACENCAEKKDVIDWSVNSNTGIVTVNQSAGNMNNQGSALSIAVDVRDGDGGNNHGTGGFAESQAAVDQKNGVDGREYREGNIIHSINILFREATIENSINSNSGVVLVNQSPGNMNNQANAVSVAVSLKGGVAMSEADLGQVNAYNRVYEYNVTKTATINGSINNNSGIVAVNQAAGNMANQANVVSVAAAIH